jgi:hypothetical protein
MGKGYSVAPGADYTLRRKSCGLLRYAAAWRCARKERDSQGRHAVKTVQATGERGESQQMPPAGAALGAAP